MSKDNSSLRSIARTTSKTTQFLENENENENEFEHLSNPINSAPPRTPLNSIPDPSQYLQNQDKLEAIRAVGTSDTKVEGFDHHQLVTALSKRGGNAGPNPEISRVSNRGKTQSEPNSAHSTPARRISSIGALGMSTGSRVPLYTGEKVGSSSRVSRGLSVGNSDIPAEITHFELEEDPSFWNDHNVQTLVRIRPISNTEKVQRYGRCLRQESPQSLMWLGHPELRFTFDHIACETISQEKLFRVAGLPMVDNCMSGYNSCMFAYGQTGSGKTYTMMGDIGQIDGKLNKDCGITPRIFEYLFTRIEEEEESRRDERLKYSCKCSFLEIYNEQITDLLEPSSTNLQLREDLKKGVYVENLMEHNVRTVNDVLRLLLQGNANRKIAATHMNSESSRSHSVFTCIIESHWEKDSMTHLRFGRLNLVDLAGSERQKSSGAEGDRLKEAANINKSLSTLGLVIMSLVDLAQGKHRHVPYRDSRLTFLLQDSLGGNSKTTIIANVSPSICSASETLSTLKFAQRAKLIQNNAKVNEDASGDVTALQRQIQQLKGQLSFLMKTDTNSRPFSHSVPSFPMRDDSSGESDMYDDHSINGQKWKIKCLEATLVGALRREKFAETEVRRLEAEVEQMNRLAQQREEDAQRSKMLLRFRQEKIKRLEKLAQGLVSVDNYLMDENQAHIEEIEFLRARIDRNPELTRFALENIRLLEQLRLFQNFYEQGERETLLAEVSELRDQLLEALEAQENYDQRKFLSRQEEQDNGAVKELEECKNLNAKLVRDLEELRNEVRQYKSQHQAAVQLVETIPIGSDSGDKMLSSNQQGGGVQHNQSDLVIDSQLVLQSSDTLKELMDTKNLMEASETEQVRLIKELQFVRQENHKLMEILNNKEQGDGIHQNRTLWSEGSKDFNTKDLQVKLDKMTVDLEEARLLGSQYRQNHESICEEVEIETTKTILHLQEEVAALQSELQEKVCSMAQEIDRLKIEVADKEDEIREIHAEWGKASLELTSFLLDGSRSLRDASSQIEYIASSFPQVNVDLREHVEKAAKVCVEKDEIILFLEKSLEEAGKTVLQMDHKLNSLKSAAMVLTEIQQLENDTSTKEAVQLTKSCNLQFVSDGKVSQASSFFNKFEEARATMQEADVMLNALLKANESSRQLTGMWKQAGEDLMVEKASLIEEIDQLKSLIRSKDGENEILEDQIHYSFIEISNLMSSLEGSFRQMQSDMEEMCKAVYSDVLMMAREMLRCIYFSRSSVEDICANAMEKEFASFVVHQCSVGKYVKKFRSLNEERLCKNLIGDKDILVDVVKGKEEEDQTAVATGTEAVEVGPSHDDVIKENLELKKELERKEILLKGLLFDFSLLQESTSTMNDLKVETENLIKSLSQTQHELQIKTSQLDDLQIQNSKLETALFASSSELEQAKESLDILSEQNTEYKVLLKELYLKKSEDEEQLEEQIELVKSLEKEILLPNSSSEKQLLFSIEEIENNLRRVTEERDQLREEIISLRDGLDMAHALADENEAIAVEARQESEESKIYAEQKEEEVKILEHSVEELERTINVLEEKVYEMEKEVERHRIIRDSSELELQTLKQRLLTVENFTETRDSENLSDGPAEDQLSRKLHNRSLELHEAHKRIIALEEEIAERTKEIKHNQEYISELVLHAEAQASQYQQKYKTLEAMFREVKTDSSNLASASSTLDKTEKNSTRTRGSSSPFRCIGGLVQQMNLEKEKELSISRLRIKELESLLASRQKEVCMLNTRLAAAESMTHDVIRDLLGVKLDMTNYANLMDQHQLQKLVLEAQQRTHESLEMEKEILNLRNQINDLIEERERCILEVNRREADIFAFKLTVEQIQERDQLLTAQNEMLKVDKTNLQRKVAELDDMVKKLCGTQTTQPRVQQQINSLLRSSDNTDFSRRLSNSGKQILRVNDELSQYYKSESSHPYSKQDGRGGSETKFRRHKA